MNCDKSSPAQSRSYQVKTCRNVTVKRISNPHSVPIAKKVPRNSNPYSRTNGQYNSKQPRSPSALTGKGNGSPQNIIEDLQKDLNDQIS